MATVRDRIINYLKDHPDGVDDDALAEELGLSQRQQANAICNKLKKEGFVAQRKVQGKIHNFWLGDSPLPRERPASEVAKSLTPDQDKTADWFWEGNVQAQMVKFLASQNFLIRSVADTASRQQGIDIVAELNGKPLWVSVKGYPRDTARTRASTQAGHWFKEAVFDILKYRGQSKDVNLGLALPDYPRYRSMAAKIAWLKSVVGFVYFWVQENGEVVAE
jgi:hypothetical protein